MTALLFVLLMHGRPASAQTASAAPPAGSGAPPVQPDDTALAAGRTLFADALRDENAKRFDVALEKFQRVRRVRDTAPVEYRIASCYEGLGRRAEAYGAYRTAVALGQDDAASANSARDVVRSAQERIDVLSKHVARLTVVVPPGTPPDAAVRVDDAPVTAEALRQPLPVEPGNHVVAATAAGARPFRGEVALPEGGEATLSIALQPLPPPPPPPPPQRADLQPSGGGGARRTVGWGAVVGGGLLIGGAAVALVLWNSDVASINRSCPNGMCRAADRSSIESTRSRAIVEDGLGIGLGAAGAAAIGLGAYLVLTSRPGQARPSLGPLVGPGVAGVAFRGALP